MNRLPRYSVIAGFWLLAGLSQSARVGAQSNDEMALLGGPQVLHMPESTRIAEQGILRPVPVVADLPMDLSVRARRVLVHYRLWGDPDWTTLELRRNGARYEGAIPCLEISTVTGDLKYYIRVHDAEGRVIATGASRADPYKVTIKHDEQLETIITRAKCPDPADCPAGLPGCPSEKVKEIACNTDADCEGGSTCSWRGFCERIDRKKNWISLGVSQEIGIVPTTGACGIHQQEHAGYACFRADGEQYIGNPVLTNEPLGVGRGTTRVIAGYERLVHYDTTLGLRVGWSFFGEGPTPNDGTEFVPFFASARVTHWMGKDPFAREGFRPFVFVAAGYSMVDVKTTAFVREDPFADSYQGGNDLEQTVELWKRAGDGFVGVGGGTMFSWQAGRAAFVELAVHSVFPFSAIVVVPTAGVMIGF
ncbi:MAG: hypothetical protein IPM54_26405 [Polyangiaceae bacterium]|nr:hypothetical protein [Polyangiaceae bacterium]